MEHMRWKRLVMQSDGDSQPLLTYWLLPAAFFTIRAFLFGLFVAVSAPVAGPHTNESSMMWLLWIYADFPLSLLGALVSHEIASSNLLLILTLFVLGSGQWVIWGLLLTWIIRARIRKKRKRG